MILLGPTPVDDSRNAKERWASKRVRKSTFSAGFHSRNFVSRSYSRHGFQSVCSLSARKIVSPRIEPGTVASWLESRALTAMPQRLSINVPLNSRRILHLNIASEYRQLWWSKLHIPDGGITLSSPSSPDACVLSSFYFSETTDQIIAIYWLLPIFVARALMCSLPWMCNLNRVFFAYLRQVVQVALHRLNFFRPRTLPLTKRLLSSEF